MKSIDWPQDYLKKRLLCEMARTLTARSILHTAQRLYYPSGNYSHLFMGARHFVTFLAATGQLPSPALIPRASLEPQLLVEFHHWMQTHRWTTAATLHNYRLPLRDFLAVLGQHRQLARARSRWFNSSI